MCRSNKLIYCLLFILFSTFIAWQYDSKITFGAHITFHAESSNQKLDGGFEFDYGVKGTLPPPLSLPKTGRF